MTMHLRGLPVGRLYNPQLETKDNEDSPVNAKFVKELVGNIATTFKEYQSKNDARLEELAKKGTSDVVTRDELKKMDGALNDFQKKLDEIALREKRPIVADPDGTKREMTEEEVEHKKDFNQYFRRGQISQKMAEREQKALSAGSNPDGGYTVPVEIDRNMSRLLSEASPIRSIASVINISTGLYTKLFNLGGAGAGWVGEMGARPTTASPTMAQIAIPVHELYAMPAATQTLLDDSAINIEEWLANEVRITFAEKESLAFVNGDGVAKPQGFLQYTKIADASWAWGKIGYIATGQAGFDTASASVSPADDIIDMVYSLKQGYRANARFVTNRLTLSSLRKFKDGDGNYIWQPGMTAGQPSAIFGYPVTEAEDMPDVADGAYPIAFGDFREGYIIVDRIGIRVLRDPFTSKPFVLFYTTKRVGGGVYNFEAIKLLKTAAS